MKKLIQTRLHLPDQGQIGNCFATVIACLLGLKSAEEVIQIQEYYEDDNWSTILTDWLNQRGWSWVQISDHLKNDNYYLVIGESPRGVSHVCIYKNGELYHDPHPSGEGLVNEKYFELIEKVGLT